MHMKKLWEKGWALDKFIEGFETKDDMLLDNRLAEFDVYCSMAHADVLRKLGILTDKEHSALRKALLEVLSLVKSGRFSLKEGDEDIHTKIELFISRKYGEVGKKMHTGRSRNDQVLTDMRLYTKRGMLGIWDGVLDLSLSFLAYAKRHEFAPMPGYTHMQKAMPSSLGMWYSAFAEALLDDLEMLKSAYMLNDKSPLGSAASYGVPLPLDRAYAARLLGFGAVQQNSLYCQNSRGKVESAVISSLYPVLYDINRFASDVMLFTTGEFNYFSIDKRLCSGSSIMPQKMNVDIAELLRGKVHLLLGYYTESAGLSSNLFSGYNRDIQDGKMPLFRSLDLTRDSLKAAGILLKGLWPNLNALRKSLTPEIFATHKALGLVSGGMPFRDAYARAGNEPYANAYDALEAIKGSSHIGGTGNLMLGAYLKRIKGEKAFAEKKRHEFDSAIERLVKG